MLILFPKPSCTSQELATQKKKGKAKVTTIPRLATANHLKKLDRSLELAGQELGLEFCRNWEDLETHGMLQGVETGNFDAAKVAAFSQVSAPSVLSTASDQEQVQVTADAFCEDPGGLRLTKVSVFDFFHRWWNCLKTAQAKASLTNVFYAAVMIYNIGYGPWETCAWWGLMLSQTTDLASAMEDDSPLLLAFWRQILVDKRLDMSLRDEDVGRPARKRFIESLSAKGSMDLRNKKVKPSIWMSFHEAHDAWDEHIGTRGLMLASLCLRKGWLSDISQLFGSPSGVQPESGVQPGGTAGAVKSARAKLEALKKKSGHSVAAVAKLTADSDVIGGIRLLAHGSRCIYTYFSRVQRDLKGPKSCAAFSQEWASWGWLEPLKQTLMQREAATELRRGGFTVVFPSSYIRSLCVESPEVVYQDSLAKTFGSFTMAIVSEISGHMLWWSAYYPGMFALMQSSDHRVVKLAMSQFHDDCKAYWAAKAAPSA